MKNRDFWNTKKELDKISARLEKSKGNCGAASGTSNAQGEDNLSDAGRHLQTESVLLSLLIGTVTCVLVAVLVIVTFLGQGMSFSLVWLIPAVAAFLIMIPASYFIIRLRNRHFGVICKKLEEMTNGIYDDKEIEEDTGIYNGVLSDLNTICSLMSEREDDLRTALRLANAANETKSNFLSNISHEIRTPINAIVGMNEMIIRESDDVTIKNYSMEAKNAAETVLSAYEELIDSALLESGRMEIIPAAYNFRDMILSVINDMYPKTRVKKLDFDFSVDPDIPAELFGDAARIRQCIMNLLTNAVKYTDRGGISLKVEYTRGGNDRIDLLISVKDSGIGLDKDELKHITEPFERGESVETGRTSGVGLGIFITSQLLKLMSSELTVDSAPGTGSVFAFRVSQKVLDWKKIGNINDSVNTGRGTAGNYSATFNAPNARILVVDDSTVNLLIVQGLLKNTQINVDTAESGAEAVSLAKINKYDIAYVDHMMPEMDGIETMRHIRNDLNSLNRRIPIIVLTANVVPGGREEYIREGFNDYICKPVDPAVLEKSVLENLPRDKVIFTENSASDAEQSANNDTPVRDEFLDKLAHIQGVTAALGITYAGGLELYRKVVEEFTVTGMSRADIIEQYYEQGDVRNYTIQVHALKSSARLLGAQGLSDLAAHLEEAGKNYDVETIEKETSDLLRRFRELVTGLQPIFEVSEDLPEIDETSLKEALMAISEMVEAFDFDSADSVMEQLKKVKIPEKYAKDYAKLKTLMAEVARDDIIELVKTVINSNN